jgi:hypothetical protein
MLDLYIIEEIRKREQPEERPTVDIPEYEPDNRRPPGWYEPGVATGSADRGVVIIDLNP